MLGSRGFLSLFLAVLFVSGCAGSGDSSYPEDPYRARKEARGKLTGDGLNLLGGDEDKEGGAPGLGVNSFLWRATLDTLSFMPLASADPFGGVIITDWYEDPNAVGERFKVNALILDKTLRSDGVRVTLFKQKKDEKGVWKDAPVDNVLSRQLEDTILTRARELKVASISKK